MQFRKDINGLRAIAVVFVVLFHFFPHYFSGGFVGVDIFFVISGYLMTKIICGKLDNENFSLIQFYLARVRRIFPALLLLLLVILIFGWFYFSPPDFRTFGKQFASSATFLSNIVYWMDSGYFSAVSRDNWLLHTWSLSVEWQFYILYPIALMLLYKTFNGLRFYIGFIVATVLLFILSVITSVTDPDMSFYLLPFRAWEMMVGGVAALTTINLRSSGRFALQAIGMVFIALGMLVIKETPNWPSPLSLIPVLGAFLIILANRTGSFLLENKVSQFFGYISYSLYLWHWPIVVLLYKLSLSAPINSIVGILVAIILAVFSYEIIEKRVGSSRKVSVFTNGAPVIIAVLFSVLGSYLFISNGLPKRGGMEWMAEAVKSPLREKCHSNDYDYIAPKDSCRYFGKDIKWAVLGDSHVIEVAYSLAEKFKQKGVGVSHHSYSYCLPAYNINSSMRKRCREWTESTLEYLVKNKNIENVVIAYRYSAHLFGENFIDYPSLPDKTPPISVGETKEQKREIIWQSFYNIVDYLAVHKKRIFIMLPIPELDKSIHAKIFAATIADYEARDIVGVPTEYYLSRNKYILEKFSAASFPENVKLINAMKVMCNTEACYAVKDSIPLYYDDDHLSIAGARLVVEQIVNSVDDP